MLLAALVAAGTACTGGEPRQLAPHPRLGRVTGGPRTCNGTLLAPGEVLVAASCVAGARIVDLRFAPDDGGPTLSVEWVVHGQDANAGGPDDWALLALQSENASERPAETRTALPSPVTTEALGARYLGERSPGPLSVGAPLWWAASAGADRTTELGLCNITGLISVADHLAFELVRHDCSLTRSTPGVLLYQLQGSAPRAIAFQGNTELAVPVAAFADVPLPARDLFVTPERFAGVEVQALHALDGNGRLSQRRRLGATWMNWMSVARPPARLLRLDGASRPTDFTGPSLENLWALDETGRLYSYSVTHDRFQLDDAPNDQKGVGDTRLDFVDLSVARSLTGDSALFALSAAGPLCARLDPTRTRSWTCTDVGQGGLAVDATETAGGYLVVVAHNAALTAAAFVDGRWQAPFALASDEGHRQVTANTTPEGALWVVATHFDRLRVRVGSKDASTWSAWAPLHTIDLPGAVTALDGGRSDSQAETVYAIAAGEILAATELAAASLDTWLTDPTAPPEFGPWKRLHGASRPPP